VVLAVVLLLLVKVMQVLAVVQVDIGNLLLKVYPLAQRTR
jgi:hypothetical protein